MRFYITDFTGDGITPETGWVPYFRSLNPISPFKFFDLRLVGNVNGEVLVWTENTDTEHSAAIADPRINYIPAENDDGSQLAWADTLEPMNTGKFNQLTGIMESMRIPADDLVQSDTVEKVFLRLIKTRMVQRYIRYVDIFAPPVQLHSNWVDIDPTIRAVAEQRLAEHTFDLSIVSQTVTVSDVLTNLSSQDILALDVAV